MRTLKNKKGLSVVVTTLIILVVSVLLATVVTFYAINVVTTRVQEEDLKISELHVWCTNDGDASAAFLVTNTGGRDVVIDKITVRGRKVDPQYVFYWKLAADVNPPNELVWVASDDPLNYLKGNYSGSDFRVQGTNSLILPSGERMVIYLFNLSHISTTDIGVTVGVVVFTANAQYHKEANIEAAG
ncbi:MAG: hypothetical protein NZ932_00915 [Candidatus Bathyarchaeota archaeon]|nr:hypothetical protein [Candidatus Bathyarchaeota archaeon]MDW8040201.1 hypothetical protein [Nitrososphaerota archaeon]